jgi:hypothetical protein
MKSRNWIAFFAFALVAATASAQSASWTPPPCSGVFNDVACPSQLADWIEALSAEGITAGCGGGNFCPTATVTRAQIAVFLLKMEHRTVFGTATLPGTPLSFCPSYTVTDPLITSSMLIVAMYTNIPTDGSWNFYPLSILSVADGSFEVSGDCAVSINYVARER